jgi:hypothetical protein
MFFLPGDAAIQLLDIGQCIIDSILPLFDSCLECPVCEFVIDGRQAEQWAVVLVSRRPASNGASAPLSALAVQAAPLSASAPASLLSETSVEAEHSRLHLLRPLPQLPFPTYILSCTDLHCALRSKNCILWCLRYCLFNPLQKREWIQEFVVFFSSSQQGNYYYDLYYGNEYHYLLSF